ncbi:MAG: hypothetical protein K9W44_06710 [Candidatus Lokiarchaeota archaeon]|nr:hypothetical protein [Candidatus Harpocratesius repetitus]
MLFEISFPTSNNLQFYIPISFVIIILHIQTAGIALYRSFLYKKSSPFTSQVLFAYGFLLTSQMLGFIFLSLERFLIWNLLTGWSNEYFYIIGWYLLGIGGFGANLIFERSFSLTSKYPYLFSSLSFLLILINLFNWENATIGYFSVVLFFIINFFIFLYWLRLYLKSSNQIKKFLRDIMIGFLIGSLNLMAMNKQIEEYSFSEILYIILYIGQFIGCVLQFHAVFHIKTLNDADWRSSILEIAIIHQETKEILLYQDFTEKKMSDLTNFSSSINALEEILKLIEINPPHKTEAINIERDQNQLIILYYKNLIGVLITSQPFYIYPRLLLKILVEFSYEYHYILFRKRKIKLNQVEFKPFLQRLYQLVYG